MLSTIISLSAASLIRQSEFSGPVIALRSPTLGSEPLWFAISFERSETQIHSPSSCPAFIECPSLDQSKGLLSFGGSRLGDIAAVEFRPEPQAPHFSDVGGVLGLHPSSLLARTKLIALSETENQGTKLTFAERDDSNPWNTVAWFETIEGNGWQSEGLLTVRNAKGKSTKIESNGQVKWNPLSEDVVLPFANRRLFEHVVNNRVHMECDRLEKRNGLASIELIVGDKYPRIVRLTVSMVKTVPSTTIGRIPGFKTKVCPTNIVLRSDVVVIGMKSVLDKYSVVLDGYLRRISFVDKSATIGESGPVTPDLPRLPTFRLVPQTAGNVRGWLWERTGSQTEKDFVIVSRWPFGNRIEIAPSKAGRELRDSNIFVPESIVSSWTGIPRFTLRADGSIEVEEEASWILTKMHHWYSSSNRMVVGYEEIGRRYAWDDESKLDGADQRLIAKPSTGRAIVQDEFFIQWPPRLGQLMYRRTSKWVGTGEETKGVWFGNPLMHVDGDNRIIITSDGGNQDYMMILKYVSYYMLFRFREIDRYIPVISGSSSFGFKRVYGPTRYEDEFEFHSTSLMGDDTFFQISLFQIDDRPDSIQSLFERLKPLEKIEFSGKPVLQADPETRDITVSSRANGRMYAIRIGVMTNYSVTIYFEAKASGIALPRKMQGSSAGSIRSLGDENMLDLLFATREPSRLLPEQ